jgi:hypothetical protein
MGGKPRKKIDPDEWLPMGMAGALRVEKNAIGAVRLVVVGSESHWVLLPWEVAPLAAMLAEMLAAQTTRSPQRG